jgi:hypothetical protein
MKLTAIISLLAIVLLGSTAAVWPRKRVVHSISLGTWKAQLSPTEAILYRFDSKGAVTVFQLLTKVNRSRSLLLNTR